MKDFSVFCDESSHKGKQRDEPCFVISAFVIETMRVPAFNEQFEACKRQHGTSGEIHWKKIRDSHGRANFLLEQFHKIRRAENVRLSAIVVHKQQFRKWHESDREHAFYLVYTMLLKHLCDVPGRYEINIDKRSDSYAKHNEVLERIVGSMIGQASAVSSVLKKDSDRTPGIQIADVLCGSIANWRNETMDGRCMRTDRKEIARRLARVLGLKSLDRDTRPHERVNIWHFPIEMRAKPRPSQAVSASSIPEFFAGGELALYRSP